MPLGEGASPHHEYPAEGHVGRAGQQRYHLLKVRRSTTPEAKLAEIQDALGINPHPVCLI